MFEQLHRSRWLRQLHWFHRISGAATAVIVLVWFVSGIVMVFHRYPQLSDSERLTLLDPLDSTDTLNSPAELGGRGTVVPTSASLQRSIRGEPVYVFTQDDRRRAVSAIDGHPTATVTAKEAEAFARQRWPHAQPRWLETHNEPDTWTVHPRFRPYFPLHRIAIDDPERNLLYVSARTGEAVQLASSGERFWAYLGAIPHWLYFTPIRRHSQAWKNIVVTLSVVAMVVALAGWVLGLARGLVAWRRSKRITPFVQKRWFRVHHLCGLAFGPFVVTWLASGALSLLSFQVEQAHPQHPARWRRAIIGSNTGPDRLTIPLTTAVERCRSTLSEVRSVRFRVLGDRPYYHCADADNSSLLLWTEGGELRSAAELPRRVIAEFTERLPSDRPLTLDPLPNGDDYVFQHRHEPEIAGLYRLSTPNDVTPRIYISARDAQIYAILNARSRAHRWLYSGLHNLDLRLLYDHGSVWLVTILLLLTGGLAISVTATRLSARTLFRGKSRAPRRRPSD